MFLLASCGSGGTVGTDMQVGPDLSGTYSGTYTTNIGATPIPFTLNIIQRDVKTIGILGQVETTYTGTFLSRQIYGQVSGKELGFDLSLTLTEPNDGGQISMSGNTNGTLINITSITGTDSFGTYTSGSGSCTRVIPVP